VQEVLMSAEPMKQVGQRHGVPMSVISRWCLEHDERHPEEEGARGLSERVAELERMVGRLTMENAFLKKFAAWTKQQTSERSSIVTAKTLGAYKQDAGYLGLRGAPTTTQNEIPERAKTPGSKIA
jgi:transposase-like protein